MCQFSLRQGRFHVVTLAPDRYIEDCCVTLVLKDQQFVTFRLDSAHASESAGSTPSAEASWVL